MVIGIKNSLKKWRAFYMDALNFVSVKRVDRSIKTVTNKPFGLSLSKPCKPFEKALLSEVEGFRGTVRLHWAGAIRSAFAS